MKVGNKQNSYLNGQWARHGRPFWKKLGSKIRRALDKKIIKDENS